MILLPKPQIEGGISLDKAINNRYSCRDFSDKKLNLVQISNLLWSAAGKSKYRRTIPSAGATYPLEFYLIVGKDGVEKIESGVYLYNWQNNSLEQYLKQDIRRELTSACLSQDFINQAPISILISADYKRTTAFYGKRGERYVHMEVGHACQNIHLEAISLGLGTVVIGAFYDEKLKALLKLKEEPLAIMPVGYPKSRE